MAGVPGKGGPVPKRSDQRRRRNKDNGEVVKVVSDGEVRGPDLKGQHCAVAKRFYEGLRRSGQAQFFEPSDWAAAELAVLAIDAFVKRPSAVMLSSINSAMSNLLVTEGDRRRVRMELERPAEDEETADVSWIEDARRRLDAS